MLTNIYCINSYQIHNETLTVLQKEELKNTFWKKITYRNTGESVAAVSMDKAELSFKLKSVFSNALNTQLLFSKVPILYEGYENSSSKLAYGSS